MEHKEFESAFPVISRGGVSSSQVFMPGMSMRDYFAGLAMQGVMSDPRNFDGQTINSDSQIIAKWAYQMADAMLEERSKCLNS